MNLKNTEPSPRIPLRINVEFRKNYARQSSLGTLENISESGAFLTPREDLFLCPKDKIQIIFAVSGRKRKINATIVWQNGRGVGVHFLPFNNQDVQIVDDFMYFVKSCRESRRDVLSDIFERVS